MRRTAWLLGLLVLLIYVLTASGHIQSVDFELEQDVARSIVHLHRFTTSLPVQEGGGAVVGVGGGHYAPHGIGMSLLLVPATLLTDLVRPGDLRVASFAASFTDALLAAASVVVMFLFARDLGARPRVAVAVALLLGLATIQWPYAHSSFDVTASGLALLLAVFAAHRHGMRGAAAWLLLSGSAAGAAVLLRAQSLVVLPALAAYVAFLVVSSRRRSSRRLVVAVLAWAVPLAVAGVAAGWYNWARFGSVLDDGHRTDPNTVLSTPLLQGVAGLLLTPGKSLLLFSPVLVLALAGLARFLRRHPALGVTCLAMVLLNLLVNAKLANWPGDDAWGPRFTVPVTALMLLFVLGWFEDGAGRRRRAPITVAVCTASVAVQLLGVGFDYLPLARAAGAAHRDFWSARSSQVTVHALAAAEHLGLGVHDPLQRVGVDTSTGRSGLSLDVWWALSARGHSHRLVLAAVLLALLGGIGAAGFGLARQLAVAPRPTSCPGV